MTKSQWFFAHSKQDDPIEIDQWCQELAVSLSSDDWEAVVISGRDDYENRSAALGGWKAWCRDVPCGIDYTGAPLYHGVIVPVDSVEESPTVGKATAQILQGFIDQSKHVYAWCPDSKSFRQVSLIEPLDDDSWVSWARLEFTS